MGVNMNKKPTYDELEQRVHELELAESEHKKTIASLQENEKSYQHLFEHMLHEVHIWELIHDASGEVKTWKLVDANPAALKSWGESLSEIIGKTTDEIFPNSNATELFMPIVKDIFKENKPKTWESYFSATNQILHMVSIPFGKFFISTGVDITNIRKSEMELERRIEYEHLLAKISSELAGLRPEHFDQSIDRTLSLLGDFTNSDRAYIFQFKNDLSQMDNTHEWCGKGIEPQIEKLKNISLEDELPWFNEHIIQKGKPLYVPDVTNLPDDARLERIHFESQGIKSLIAVPIRTAENLVGFLGFDAVRERRDWNDDHKFLLQYCSQTLCHVIERQRIDSKLRKREFIFSQTFEQSSTSTCFYDPEGTIIRVNQEFCRMFGVREQDILNARYNIFRDRAVIEAGFVPIIREIFEDKKTRRWEISFDVSKASSSTGTPTSKTGTIDLEVFGHPVVNHRNELEFVVLKHYDITTRKQAEKKLENERALLSAVFDNIEEAIIICDEKGKLARFNEAARRLHGLPELPIPPDQWAQHYDLYNEDGITPLPVEDIPLYRALNGEQVRKAEIVVAPQNGVPYHLVCSGQALTDEMNRTIGAVVAMHDITDRKEAEAKLRQSEKKYRTLYENAAIGIFHSSFEGRFLDVNPSLARMLGYAKPQDVVDSIYSIAEQIYVEPPVRDEVINQMLARGETIKVENRYRRKDGSEWDAYLHLRCVFDKYGRPAYLEGFVEDITERKQAEKKLVFLKRRNQALLDYSPVCHKIVDLDFNLQYMSASGFKMLKLDHDAEVYGKPYPFYFFPESFRKEMLENLMKVKETGVTITSEALAKDSKGNEVWLESSLIPVFDDDGKIDYLTVVSANTTQRKKHEQEKKRFEEQFKQSQKMEAIGTLAGGIAHDFNNMLGIIIGNISYALGGLNKNDELYEVLTDVQQTSKQAQGLTHQLLTFSKGGEPIRKSADINKIISDAAIFSIRGAKSKCSFELSDDLWPSEVDEGQMNQVVNNLVMNANQAMPNGGVITIRTENVTIESKSAIPLPAGRYIKIAVEDQGVGISTNHLANIFEPYFTTKQKGSGLGLATAYAIIKKHDGHITVYSEIEKGAVFHIYLPASGQTAHESRGDLEQKHAGQGRILIMDDQEAILKMAGRMLNRMGYEIKTSTDGAEAIELYREAHDAGNPFELVILDLTVPGGVGGAKTIPELLKIDPKVKAVVSSGYCNDAIMANYKDYGFRGVVAKPYTKAQLSEVLNKIFADKG